MEIKTVTANEVELVIEDEKKEPPINKLKKKQSKKKLETNIVVNVKVTFWTHVGWDGILMMLFSCAIAAIFLYIAWLYSQAFHAIGRSGVWVFVVLAALYASSVVKSLPTLPLINSPFEFIDI